MQKEITLKWHDGKEQSIDGRGLVSHPVLDSDGQCIAYYKEEWRGGRTLVIHTTENLT